MCLSSGPFLALQQFFGGYFHQDFLLDYASPQDAVLAFKSEASGEVIREVCGELEQLMEAQRNSDGIKDLLLSLGSYYEPSSAGLSDIEWLAHIQRTLSC